MHVAIEETLITSMFKKVSDLEQQKKIKLVLFGIEVTLLKMIFVMTISQPLLIPKEKIFSWSLYKNPVITQMTKQLVVYVF